MLDLEYYMQNPADDIDEWEDIKSRPCFIRNQALRLLKGEVYYFNDHDIYAKCTLKEAEKHDIDGMIHQKDSGRIWVNMPLLLFGYAHSLRMAATKAEVGTKWPDFVDLWKKLKEQPREKQDASGVNGVVSKIASPKIERAAGNRNTDTFDFVRVEVGLIGDRENQKASIDEHIDEIGNMVLEKIANSKKFQKYSVPVNILRIGNLVWRNDGVLEYTFEVKELEKY